MRLVRSTLVRSFGLAALAAGLAALVAFGSSAALAAGDAAKGKENFMKYGCWQCHGTVGQGSPVSGPEAGAGTDTARSDVVLHPEQPG